MSEAALQTTNMHRWIDALRAGDDRAAEDLLRAVGGRLDRLARRMLKGFPNVRRWADTDDVLQGASLRLFRTLKSVRPATTRDFFNLAAVQIRRELLDLARHYGGPQGIGANHDSVAPGATAGPVEAAEATIDDVGELDRWAAFHRAVEALPVEEREVMGLVFYHGWTHEQIAGLFQVSDRTIRRYWQSACRRLGEALADKLPNLTE
jgi:RNA polymerase sigma factor (sigma-70 family)